MELLDNVSARQKYLLAASKADASMKLPDAIELEKGLSSIQSKKHGELCRWFNIAVRLYNRSRESFSKFFPSNVEKAEVALILRSAAVSLMAKAASKIKDKINIVRCLYRVSDLWLQDPFRKVKRARKYADAALVVSDSFNAVDGAKKLCIATKIISELSRCLLQIHIQRARCVWLTTDRAKSADFLLNAVPFIEIGVDSEMLAQEFIFNCTKFARRFISFLPEKSIQLTNLGLELHSRYVAHDDNSAIKLLLLNAEVYLTLSKYNKCIKSLDIVDSKCKSSVASIFLRLKMLALLKDEKSNKQFDKLLACRKFTDGYYDACLLGCRLCTDVLLNNLSNDSDARFQN